MPSPEAATFLVDRSLGSRKVPGALRSAGAKVELHETHFPSVEEDDAAWISEAGRRGWVILTRDEAIIRRPKERDAILRFNARIFIPDKRKGTGDDWGKCYAHGLQPMVHFLARREAPFLARVTLGKKGFSDVARVRLLQDRQTLEELQRLAGWPVPQGRR